MKSELTRLRDDLEVIQKAIGLGPAPGRQWVPWLKRDMGLYLLYCVPGGLLLLAGWLLPSEDSARFGGLLVTQWIGLLTAAMLIGLLLLVRRCSTEDSGRPEGLVREDRRASRHVLLLLPPLGLYFIWGAQHHVEGAAFTAGLWILGASLLGIISVLSGLRVYLGWALPMAVFGLSQSWIAPEHYSLALGGVFIAGALLCAWIQRREIHRLQKPNASH